MADTPITELLYWLRNSDVMTTTERGVTTATATGTFTATSNLLINRTNVKNVRSVVVDSSTLTYGSDYTYDIDYDDSGTIKCRISFTTAQTGSYSISYDYGTDTIYDDYPRDDLKINSYPRIVIDLISEVNDAYGIGGSTFIENSLFTVVIYSKSQDYIRSHIETVKLNLMIDAKSFNSFIFVKPTSRGPIVKPEGRSNTILQGNIDFAGMFRITNV